MDKSEAAVIERLAADTKIGYSLDRKFYCDDAVFEADMDRVVSRKWIVAGHVDRVRNKGDYFSTRSAMNPSSSCAAANRPSMRSTMSAGTAAPSSAPSPR